MSQNAKPLRRRSYTADFKLQVVEYAAEKGRRPAVREFGVSAKLVRDWCKAESTLISMKKTKRANRGLKARWPELEQRVHTWVLGQKAGLSTVKLRLHAQRVAKEMEIIDFSAGPSWCFRFMKRNHVSIKAKMSEEVTDSQAKMDRFRAFIEKEVAAHDVSSDHILHMQEVPLTFYIPMSQKSVVTHERWIFTVVLACCGDGSKLPPMVIFKQKTMPEADFSSSIVVTANEKGCLNEETMSLWLAECYCKRPDGFFETHKALLVMDSQRGAHISQRSEAAIKACNSIAAVIPAELTEFLQPLHASVSRSFTAVFRQLWDTWMLDGEHVTVQGVVGWVNSAWASVTSHCILRGFRKAALIGADSDGGSRGMSEQIQPGGGVAGGGVAGGGVTGGDVGGLTGGVVAGVPGGGVAGGGVAGGGVTGESVTGGGVAGGGVVGGGVAGGGVAGGGVTGEGVTGEGVTGGGVTGGGVTGEGVPGGGVTGEGVTGGGVTGEGVAGGGVTGGGVAGGGVTGEGVAGGGVAGEGVAGGGVAGGGVTGGGVAGGGVTGEDVPGGGVTGGGVAGGGVTGEGVAGGGVTGGGVAGGGVTGGGVAGGGVPGEGVAGGGVTGGGVPGGGVTGEGVAGEGVAGGGVTGEGVTGEGVAGGGVTGGGVPGGGVAGGGVTGVAGGGVTGVAGGGVTGGGVTGGGVTGGGMTGGGVAGGGVTGGGVTGGGVTGGGMTGGGVAGEGVPGGGVTGGGVAGGGVTGGGVTGGGVPGGGVTGGGVTGGDVPGGGVTGGGVVAHLQCPFCGLFSNSHAHQLIHVGAMHPGKLEGFSVGRLGNILIYQRTAKLFHCGECFHTCRDFSKLYQHLVTKHCLDQEQEAQRVQEAQGEREGEMKEEVKEEEEEEMEDGEGKGEKEEEKESSSSLLTERGGHRCLICGWRTKHRGLAISHVVRKHDIPKAYAGQGVKYAAPPRRGEEGEFMSEELMKEEIEATNKVVGLISNRYVCLLCGWKTKRKGFAISHVVRSHDVERPYSCRSCDRSFFLPSRLQQHVSASHPLGRFRCPFCCFRSQFLGGFRRHCSRCNAREEEEEEEEERRKRSREEEEQDERRGTRKRRKTLKVQEREEEDEED